MSAVSLPRYDEGVLGIDDRFGRPGYQALPFSFVRIASLGSRRHEKEAGNSSQLGWRHVCIM